MEDMFLAANDDGVSGIGTAARAGDHIKMLAQNVGHLALALVPPLRADDGGHGSERFEELVHGGEDSMASETDEGYLYLRPLPLTPSPLRWRRGTPLTI